MQTAVGRLREGTVMDLSYITMAHNTIRGAAGGAILNAELLAVKGYLR
jgi:aspartate-semialdehyde dehydrogenase